MQGDHIKQLLLYFFLITVHSGATTCKICGKVLSRVFELRRHMEKIHGYAEEEDEGEVLNFEPATNDD